LKLRAFATLALLAAFAGGCKENHHDNSRPPAPSSDSPVQNHRFDGGESDPYVRPGGDAEAPAEKAAE